MLPELPLTVPKTYLLFKNGLWALTGLTLAVGLFLGKPWALKTVRWTAAGIGVWYWLDRVLFTRSDFARSSWPMAVIVTCVILMALLWTTRRQSVREYYRESK